MPENTLKGAVPVSQCTPIVMNLACWNYKFNPRAGCWEADCFVWILIMV